MEELEQLTVPEEGQVEQAPTKRELRQRRKELLDELKQLDREWGSKEDSEALWERKHALLIGLREVGEDRALRTRARMMKKVLSKRGSPEDLADAALANWVLELYPLAAEVLRVAVATLPRNRYPWSLLLRYITDYESPESAIEFIEGALESVPWRTYAQVQLGAKHIDAVTSRLNMLTTDGCQEHVDAARGALEEAKASEGATEELKGSADRLMVLVEHLQNRLWEIERIRREAELSGRKPGEPTQKELFESELKTVVDASEVALEGEPDTELDLEEIEREIKQEMPEEDQEDKITVIRVTPMRGKKKG